MKIYADKAQQEGKHELKHNWILDHGIELEMIPLPVGDYILENERVQDVISRKQKRGVPIKKMDLLGTYSISVDTKKDIQEIIGNVCGKQHERFRDECILAQNNGIKLIILVENTDGINRVMDLCAWENPRTKIKKWITTPAGEKRKILAYPSATKGRTLAKAMCTMQDKYGVRFEFCNPADTGRRILELLGVDTNDLR